jgi:fructokinase
MIVVAGEATIELMPGEAGDEVRAVPGGSPANVAVSLARLGQPVRLLSRLSADGFGSQIRDYLVRNGVDLDWAVTAAEPSSLAIASLNDAGQAGYDFHIDDTADWQWKRAELPWRLGPPVVAVHSGSLALALAPGAVVLEEFLAFERSRSAVTISIDLNVRPSVMANASRERARIERQIRLAHIVKASEEDLAWLYPGVPAAAIVAAWHDSGVACAVVTHGGDGAYLIAPNGLAYRRNALPVQVVDTVGAGDAFTGGMLAQLATIGALGDRPAERLAAVKPQQWLSLLEHAVTVASITCTRQGADPPTLAQIESAKVTI